MTVHSICVGRHDDPTDTDVGLLCGKCFSRLRSSLLELPAIAGWLEVNIAAGGSAGERVSGSREDPMPLRLDVLDLIGPDSKQPVAAPAPKVFLWEDGLCIGEYATWRAANEVRWLEVLATADPDSDVHRWRIAVTDKRGCDQQGVESMRAVVDFWAQTLNDECSIDRPGRDDLQSLVEYLTSELSTIASQPWAAELADDVADAARNGHRVAPWREEIRRDPDPCPICKTRAVVLHLAGGESRCERRAGGCGRKQPISDYVLNAVLPGTRRAG